LLIERR